MSVGCLLLVDSKGIVQARKPVWPFPPRDAYPQYLPDGSRWEFRPYHYYTYPLRRPFHENPR